MKREPYKEMNCSVAASLHVIGEPWTFLVIRDAFLQVRRFEEFQKNLGIARNILTMRLKRLVDAGTLRRVPYQTRPTRYEYRLTEKGAALFPIIVSLKEWGDRWGHAALNGAPLELRNRKSSQVVAPALIDRNSNQTIDLSSVRAVAGPGADQRTRDFFAWIDAERTATRRQPRRL